MGSPPPNATHWRLRRQVQGLWQQCQAGDDEVEVIEWPLSELSLGEIRQRWGAGTFRVTWMASTPKCKPVGTGRPFGLKPPAAPAAPPAPPAPAPVVQVQPAAAASPLGPLAALGAALPPELLTALSLLTVIDGMASRRADADIERARLAYQRDLERERQRGDETKAFYSALSSGQERERNRAVAAAAQASAAKVKDETRELVEGLHDRLDGMDIPEGDGGKGGGLAALLPHLPQLLAALQQQAAGKVLDASFYVDSGAVVRRVHG